MKLLVLTILSFCCLTIHAQTEIKIEDAKNHIGDSVSILAKVYGIRYLEAAKNSPTLINLGAAFPNQLLTVVIWGDVRKKLGYIPEEKISKGFIVVIGKLELYKGKPQIIITDPTQLVFLHDEEVDIKDIPPITKQNN